MNDQVSRRKNQLGIIEKCVYDHGEPKQSTLTRRKLGRKLNLISIMSNRVEKNMQSRQQKVYLLYRMHVTKTMVSVTLNLREQSWFQQEQSVISLELVFKGMNSPKTKLLYLWTDFTQILNTSVECKSPKISFRRFFTIWSF